MLHLLTQLKQFGFILSAPLIGYNVMITVDNLLTNIVQQPIILLINMLQSLELSGILSISQLQTMNHERIRMTNFT